MISTQLNGFSNWMRLNDENIKDVPNKQGVYVIRLKDGKCFGRLKGESDIIYIGSSKKLRRRFRQFLHPGPTQWTNQRINKLSRKYDFEVAWLENSEPRILEHNLLRKYLEEHDEFPPLNRADIRKLSLVLQETITLTSNMDK